MPHTPCVIDDVEVVRLPINLTHPSLNIQKKIQNSPNRTQEAMRFHNLLSLPHFHAKQTTKRKALVDYSQFHVFTLV